VELNISLKSIAIYFHPYKINEIFLFMIHQDRIYYHRQISNQTGPVIYWMSRDQRVSDNWGLIYAREQAELRKVPMAVVFCLTEDFSGATIRHYDFMLSGLSEVQQNLNKLNIPFYLLKGDPADQLNKFISGHSINLVVCDFDPLKLKRKWIKEVMDKNEVNLTEVDSHNIVPCRKASNKLEFGAYTLRPKIKKLLPEFLDPFPQIRPQPNQDNFYSQNIDFKSVLSNLNVNDSVSPVDWIKPGESNAKKMMELFISNKLGNYSEDRNDPNKDGASNLSPYFHFGQLSAQRVAMEIITHFRGNADMESFLEEMIIRRELSDNFCFYNPDYDNFSGFHLWARSSLDIHRKDEREYLYTTDKFENAETHDQLWNAAQLQMVKTGKMHGFMRMYWAKKILEWTRTPEEALKISIYLNDKYSLDGRDPNGYTGCAWSIGGVHDRAWGERPVFGKIRYMNYKGCERKFNVKEYIRSWI
jgi:deoxyribodipyrimidine photo-lyase